MAVRTTNCIFVIAICLSALAPSALSQPARSSYDPAATQSSSKTRDSFIDFTLKRINPCDKDYGTAIADGRNLIVAESIESRYFWSNLVTVSILVCFFILLVFQQRRLNRSGWRSAEVITRYKHALQHANMQIEDAKARYGEATQALMRLKESALRGQPTTNADNAQPAARAERKRPADQQQNTPESAKNGAGKPSKPNSIPGSANSESGAQIALFKADADLVSRINLLEQKLGRSKEIESELRRQVNDLGGKLKAEQEKNRSLKGA